MVGSMSFAFATATRNIFKSKLTNNVLRARNMSTVTNGNKVKVEMVSDAICPFCYIGYKNLNAGVDLAKSKGIPLNIDLEFKPFLLDPTLTKESVNKRERYYAKFGGKERVDAMEQQMVERGKKVGIDFSYGGNVSQTHDYHRLMAYAHEKGGEPLQRKLAESCFTSYFEKELDVGQPEQLVTNSVHSGVFGTEDDARKFLQSDAFDQEIKKGYREAQGLGISGVPFFIFENKFAVSGAQPPEAFVEVFERLSKDKKSQPELVEGAACEIGGKC